MDCVCSANASCAGALSWILYVAQLVGKLCLVGGRLVLPQHDAGLPANNCTCVQ